MTQGNTCTYINGLTNNKKEVATLFRVPVKNNNIEQENKNRQTRLSYVMAGIK